MLRCGIIMGFHFSFILYLNMKIDHSVNMRSLFPIGNFLFQLIDSSYKESPSLLGCQLEMAGGPRNSARPATFIVLVRPIPSVV